MHVNRPTGPDPRFERKQAAAEHVKWNSYCVHDREFVGFRITQFHTGYMAQRARALAKWQHVDGLDRDELIQREAMRYTRHRGDQSKYSPHQGVRECARRASV